MTTINGNDSIESRNSDSKALQKKNSNKNNNKQITTNKLQTNTTDDQNAPSGSEDHWASIFNDIH